MNAFDFVAVPPGVVTATATNPPPWAGVWATICVRELDVIVAAVPPTVTDEALTRSVPVMVIVVPPACGPVAGETVLMTGVGVGSKPPPEIVNGSAVNEGIVTVVETVRPFWSVYE